MKFSNYKNLDDLKGLQPTALKELGDDIRHLIYQNVMMVEGHLGSNMSVTDLTISLLQKFGTDKVRYLYDTGYQAYAFKMLTGRRDFLNKNHEYGAYSIFQDLKEHDPYSGGHTSISAAWASGYNALKDGWKTIEIIGDGSLNAGVGLGGMLNFAKSNNHGLFIMNDNKQGIGIDQFNYINWEHIAIGMGYDYYEVKDGHDYTQLAAAWEFYDNSHRNVFVKVNTIKGYGLDLPNPDEAMHYIMPNAPQLAAGLRNPISWIVKEYLTELLARDKNAMVFIPGMLYVFDLTSLKEQYPNQIIDAGIAEEISVVEACAAACAGKTVYFMVFASFMQRIYDQIVHDIARNNVNLNMIVFGAGLSTAGDSHHGIYDLNMYNGLSNITIFHPATISEFSMGLEQAKTISGPKVFRLDNTLSTVEDNKNPYSWIMSSSLKQPGKHVVITYGTSYYEMLDYVQSHQLPVDVVKATTLNPLDQQLLDQIIKQYDIIYTYEPVLWKNNLASSIRATYPDVKVIDFAFRNCHLGDWDITRILTNEGMDYASVFKKIIK